MEKVIHHRRGGTMSGSGLLSGTGGDFTVALLGGFGVFFKGSALGIPSASQRLLAFLALHGGMVRRAVVAGTLWPDASQSHAYSNLRSALTRTQLLGLGDAAHAGKSGGSPADVWCSWRR